MKLLEFIDSIFHLEGYRLSESLFFANNDIEFWHSLIIDIEGTPVAAGFGASKELARKIAIAEFLERREYARISELPRSNRDPWGLAIIPTACGFATGFDRSNAIYRSVAEAVERWVMSKWIDDSLGIAELNSDTVINTLDPVSKSFVAEFDRIYFFEHAAVVYIDDKAVKITVGQTMAVKDDGIFPGSSAQFTGGNIWQHALLESYRHLLLVRNNKSSGKFPDNKIRFFAKNKDLALAQIFSPKTERWPVPTVAFHRCESFLDGEYFVARTILEGWRSWHEGPLERFLY